MEDPLGMKAFGEATKIAIEKSIGGVESFLALTCKPAVKELGLIAADPLRAWRLKNILNTLKKAEGKLIFEHDQLQINPKVALSIMDECSNEENDDLQNMWAGLFASSYSKGGKDEENILYVSILKQLTLPEVKLIKYMCENCKKAMTYHHIVNLQTISMHGDQLIETCGLSDFNKIEIILHHLNSLRLSNRTQGENPSGFKNSDFNGQPLAWLSPTNLAIGFYLRCIGFKGSAKEYWNLPEHVPPAGKK